MKIIKNKCTLTIMLLFFSFLAIAQEKVMTLEVVNKTPMQRHEIVTLPLEKIIKELDLHEKQPFVIRKINNMDIEYQICHDGQVIFEADVRPESKTLYHIIKGTSLKHPCFVNGGIYKDRKDDIAWENDRCAYRVYGPALQHCGERAYGIDIWVKNTPELVVANRYKMDKVGSIENKRLRDKGFIAAADSVNLVTSFHIDHGNGYDPYQVGPTLGCGAPALMKDRKLIMPWCYDKYNILDNGPLRFTVSLSYKSTIIDGKRVTEHRIISLDKGSFFNHITVWYDGLPGKYDVAAGVVVHSADSTTTCLGKNYVQYADPTDNININYSQIYVACIFPEGIDTTTYLHNTEKPNEYTGHLVGIKKNIQDAEKFNYYSGASWSNGGICSQKMWQLCIDDFIQKYSNPLELIIK